MDLGMARASDHRDEEQCICHSARHLSRQDNMGPVGLDAVELPAKLPIVALTNLPTQSAFRCLDHQVGPRCQPQSPQDLLLWERSQVQVQTSKPRLGRESAPSGGCT